MNILKFLKSQVKSKKINNSCKYWCWKLPRLSLLWLVSEACQTSISAQVLFKWLHLSLTSRQFITPLDDEFNHEFSCFVWYVCGGENGTNGCHLAVFSVNVAFACHFMATHSPPTLPPCKSASGIVYASKKSKMVGNLASYPLNCWRIDIP